VVLGFELKAFLPLKPHTQAFLLWFVFQIWSGYFAGAGLGP
jgi:hypothetical protein